MKLSELIEKLNPSEVKGDLNKDITGVNIDSRQVKEGHLFIAVKGTQVDGHKFIPKAVEQGAVAVLCEDIPADAAEGVTFVKVDNTEHNVGQVATTFYGNPTEKLKLVGVTGTNGKTTIATTLYNLFRRLGWMPICFHGSKFSLHRSESYWWTEVRGRTFHQSHAGPLGLPQDFRELPRCEEDVLRQPA